ncbi:hypothetical protein BV20DRAFT_945532 [Pilatotrama ljubarskyi]|nr:hypothetical protein BV20DRAFT_945532 [Pilatotrama ljubarskyi]
MEDISYFLVGKIERSRERAKSVNQILPTYPCLQPSDTTAFRIALARYIEAIRNSIVHTSHVSEKSSELRGKQPASPAPDETPAWWWKDIVVRKSILDECCGERFERLILALSSHAVLKNSSRVTSTLQPLSAPKHAVGALNALSPPSSPSSDVLLAYRPDVGHVVQNIRSIACNGPERATRMGTIGGSTHPETSRSGCNPRGWRASFCW